MDLTTQWQRNDENRARVMDRREREDRFAEPPEDREEETRQEEYYRKCLEEERMQRAYEEAQEEAMQYEEGNK